MWDLFKRQKAHTFKFLYHVSFHSTILARSCEDGGMPNLLWRCIVLLSMKCKVSKCVLATQKDVVDDEPLGPLFRLNLSCVRSWVELPYCMQAKLSTMQATLFRMASHAPTRPQLRPLNAGNKKHPGVI